MSRGLGQHLVEHLLATPVVVVVAVVVVDVGHLLQKNQSQNGGNVQ